MDLRKYYQILDLAPGASFEEVKQAYKDAVAVWHPDRFSNNPRLKQKAERKLKDINEAFEILEREYQETKFQKAKAERVSGQADDEAPSKTEAIAELGTRLVLHACHFLFNAIKKKTEK